MTTNSPNPVDGDVQALLHRLNILAGRLKWHNIGCAQDVLKAVDILTTPPAQLLRPVELPEFKVHSNQPCWPSITVGLRDKEWIETLRQQGYEVKS